MPWFPDIANPAFCETLHLRKLILERQRPCWSTRQRVLEPGSAEFIAALAAGSNSRRILHIGCGLSTIALAAAARATGGCLECVDSDEEKQAIVGRYIVDLGLNDYVEFFPEKPSKFIPRREGFDFVLFTGEPERYIENFDLLRFKQAAIIVAFNALDDATNEYIKHVRQQPGIDSSTLPVGRGIEVSKILTWDSFKAGRKPYSHCQCSCDDEVSNTAHISGHVSIPYSDARCTRHPDEDRRFVLGISNTDSGVHDWDSTGSGYDNGVLDDGVLPPLQDQESLYESTVACDEELKSQPDSSDFESSLQGNAAFCCDALAHGENSEGDFLGQDSQGSESPEQRNGLGVLQLVQSEEGNPSPAVSVGTSLEEESARVHAVGDMNSAGEEDITLHFKNMDLQTEITVEGPDQSMLLADITMALNEANVSVQGAKISTQNNHVEDVFYVVDGVTRSLLDMDQQEYVRAKILKRIAERRLVVAA